MTSNVYPLSGYSVLPGYGLRIDTTNPAKPMFMAKDVAAALGYSDTAKAIRMHCKGVAVLSTPTAGGYQPTKFIPEGDVYRLIVRSKLPAAEQFERKVFDEILPQIRQTGGYIPAKADDSDEAIMARALKIADKTIQKLELDNASMHAKLDYSTIDAYRALHKGEYWTHGQKVKLGKRATKLCAELGIELRKEKREVHYTRPNGDPVTAPTVVNVYPTDILDRAAEEVGL